MFWWNLINEGIPALGWEEFSFLSLLLWTFGEDVSERAEHRHTFSSPGRMWLLPAAAVVDAFSLLLFQGLSNLECHTTQTQADLWWIPWRWLSMSSPIPHKETQFTLLHLPTATHHLLHMSRWWNPPHEDSMALWPDSGRRRCHCKTTRMVGICPFEHLLAFHVLSPFLPCTFSH